MSSRSKRSVVCKRLAILFESSCLKIRKASRILNKTFRRHCSLRDMASMRIALPVEGVNAQVVDRKGQLSVEAISYGPAISFA